MTSGGVFLCRPPGQKQVQNLLQQEVWDSAELLGNFLICKSKAMAADLPAAGGYVVITRSWVEGMLLAKVVADCALMMPPGLGSHAESLELYADALYGKGEYRRAVVSRPLATTTTASCAL